jgi:FtsH-binding integral membrane protein
LAPLPASEHALESTHSEATTASRVRAHIALVTSNLSGSFALAAAVAGLTDRLVPQSLAQNTAMRITIAAVPLVLCFLLSRRLWSYRDALIGTALTNMTRSLLLGYAALIGFASAVAFIANPLFSVARIFLVVALAFAAASLWRYGKLPGRIEKVIVSSSDSVACCLS